MDTLASNEEQAVGAEPRAAVEGEEDERVAVTSVRAFFDEAEEVDQLLRKAAAPSFETKACREACERVGEILVQYQEQPGLLDPRLESMVDTLMGAVAQAVRSKPLSPREVLPNMHMLSSLLYILTTVRGYKTVSRFFPHEAADLEPCLEAAEVEAGLASKDTWSSLYCLTLWLAMVLLTPFDLATIDSSGGRLASRILEIGRRGLHSTGRLRDASAWLLAKFFTRPDVAASGALTTFMGWSREAWVRGSSISEEAPKAEPGGSQQGDAIADAIASKEEKGDDASPLLLAGGEDTAVTAVAKASLAFTRCGIMQAWNQILKAAARTTVRPVWDQLVALVLHGPTGQGADEDFGSSSLLRKLRVAVASRACLVVLSPQLAPWRYDRGARSLLLNFSQMQEGGGGGGAALQVPQKEDPTREVGQHEDAEEEEDVPEQVEEVVELLLTSLSDADSVVRWAAAKGIGRVTNRLSSDFGDQVLESLLERSFDGRGTDRAWHGGCLALAELTRRGLLLPSRLPAVVPLVCKALHFELVSGRQAVGEHVRDAACYVCWAFARAYSPDVLEAYVADLAKALLPVAVFDREVNCRRAAAAAVQEHVGRQGTFPQGIDVVTIADFWTLSMRRQSYLEVAPQLAKLGDYRQCLISHLVDAKLCHQDVQIRLLAAEALTRLAAEGGEETVVQLNDSVLPSLLARAAADSASSSTGGASQTAVSLTARHGAVVGVAAIVDALQDRVTTRNQDAIRGLVPALEKARAYRGRGGEVVRQAACQLIARIASAAAWPFKSATSTRYLQSIDECARHTTDAVQVAAIDALRVLAKQRLTKEAVEKCAETYLAGLRKSDEMIAARRGFVLSLGALPPEALGAQHSAVLRALAAELCGKDLPGGADQEDPKTRQYAALSLGWILLGTDWSRQQQPEVPSAADAADVEPSAPILRDAVDALEVAMRDYATDRRGDVGSWVREACMEVLAALLEATRLHASAADTAEEPAKASGDIAASSNLPKLPDRACTTRLVALLLQQAIEKIDRLRERAWLLLRYLLLPQAPACSSASTCRTVPLVLVEKAHSRVCNAVPYTLDHGNVSQEASAKAGDMAAWPPVHVEALEAALQSGPAVAAEDSADAGASIFEALVPLLDYEEYRSAIVAGITVSAGGITEHTAKAAKRALLQYLRQEDAGQERQSAADVVGEAALASAHPDVNQENAAARAEAVSVEVLRIYDAVSPKDTDPEARRVLVALLNLSALLLSHSCFPKAHSATLMENVVGKVKSTKDVPRLRAAVAVLIGLMTWPGDVRRRALGVLLYLLGFTFPVVRQCAAQALYVRLLEEPGDFDLCASDGSGGHVPKETVAEVSELLCITPWSSNNEQQLAETLRSVYAKVGLDLPKQGRSILVPHPKATVGGASEAARRDLLPKESGYADLVREAHGMPG